MATYFLDVDSLVGSDWDTSAVSNLQEVRSPDNPSLFGTHLFADGSNDGDTWTATLENMETGLEIQSIKVWCFPVVGSSGETVDCLVKFGSVELPAVFDFNEGFIEWQSHTWSGISIGSEDWNVSGEVILTADDPLTDLEIYALYFEVVAVPAGTFNEAPISLLGNSGFRMSMIMNEVAAGGMVASGRASTTYDEIAEGGVLAGGIALDDYSSNPNFNGGLSGGGSAIVWGIVNERGFGGVKVSGNWSTSYIYHPTGIQIVISGQAVIDTSYHARLGASLGFWLTGGETNSDPDLSVGGTRSETRASRIGIRYQTAMSGVEIVDCSHNLGSTMIQAADADSVSLGDGASISLPPQYVRILEDGEQWVRVKRTISNDLKGQIDFERIDQFNNVFGGANWEDGEGDLLRAVIFSNDSLYEITALKFWVTPLTATVTCVTGLGSSGAGEITAAAGAFLDWDWKGTCRIESSGGTLKEIVHYYRIDNDSLQVVGRGVCGTSATSGTAGDKLTQVSPIRIGLETSVADVISEDADGVTFSSGISSSTGLSVSTLAPSDYSHSLETEYGLWIEKDLETAPPCPEYPVSISYSFGWQGESYSGKLKGLCRNADTSVAGYELFVGVDEDPDITGIPTVTGNSLPLETDLLDPDHVYSLVTNYRNKWGLSSDNLDFQTISIDADGEIDVDEPSAPIVDSWLATGSTFKLKGYYQYLSEPTVSRATHWKIYVSYDGADPLTKTPISIAFGNLVLGILPITWVSGSQSVPTTAKVVLRVSKGAKESTNTDVHEVTSESAEFAGNHLGAFFGSIGEAL